MFLSAFGFLKFLYKAEVWERPHAAMALFIPYTAGKSRHNDSKEKKTYLQQLFKNKNGLIYIYFT